MGFFDDITDFIFGEEGKVGQPVVTSNLSPEQEKIFKDVLAPYFNKGLNVKGPKFPGSLNVQRSPYETSSLASLEKLSDMAIGFGKTGGGTPNAINDYQNVINEGPTDFSQYYEKSVRDPLLETFNEETLPNLSNRYAKSGFYSSDRMDAEQGATEDLNEILASTLSDLAFRTRESQKDRAMSAISGKAGLQTGTLDRRLTGLGLGAQVGESFNRAGRADTDRREGNLERNYQDFIRRTTGEQRARLEATLAALGLSLQDTTVPVFQPTDGILGDIVKAFG